MSCSTEAGTGGGGDTLDVVNGSTFPDVKGEDEDEDDDEDEDEDDDEDEDEDEDDDDDTLSSEASVVVGGDGRSSM